MQSKFWFSLVIIISLGLLLLKPDDLLAVNNDPNIDSVTFSTSSGGGSVVNLTLPENTETDVYVYGSASDLDGCEQIDDPVDWSVKLYRSGVGKECGLNDNNCIEAPPEELTITGCEGGADTDLDYEYHLRVEHFADPTDAAGPYPTENWEAAIGVGDTDGGKGENGTGFDIDSTIALDVTASIDYGILALGVDSLQKTITFTNTGNVDIDADQSANGDMICTGGNEDIKVDAVHISFINGFTYGVDDQAFAASPAHLEMGLVKQTNRATPSTKDGYLILRMPDNQIGGGCSNIISFTAKKD